MNESDKSILDVVSQAMDLIQQQAKLKTEEGRLDWIKSALVLLGQVPKPVPKPTEDITHPDYLFLQQVITSKVDLSSQDTASKLSEIINDNNPGLFRFFLPAVMVLREFFLSRAKTLINLEMI